MHLNHATSEYLNSINNIEYSKCQNDCILCVINDVSISITEHEVTLHNEYWLLYPQGYCALVCSQLVPTHLLLLYANIGEYYNQILHTSLNSFSWKGDFRMSYVYQSFPSVTLTVKL